MKIKLIAFAAFFAGVHIATAATIQKYKYLIESNGEMVASGVTQKIKTHTRLDYTWKRIGEHKDLYLDSVKVIMNLDGKDQQIQTMNAKILSTHNNGIKTVIKSEDNPTAAKMLKQIFTEPLIRVKTDDSNREISRKVIAGDAAKPFAAYGVLINASLFDAPYIETKSNWQNPGRWFAGPGVFASGIFSYQKSRVDPESVLVSGTLSAEKVPILGLVATQRYKVRGIQHYNKKTSTWTSGTLSIEGNMTIFQKNKKMGTGEFSITVTFENISTKDE